MAEEKVETTIESQQKEASAEVAEKLLGSLKRRKLSLVESGGEVVFEAPRSFAPGAQPAKNPYAPLRVRGAVASVELPLSSADIQVERLRTLAALLESSTGEAERDRSQLLARKTALNAARQRNLARVVDAQRPLEKSFRELQRFFDASTAAGGEGKTRVDVVNASAEAIVQDPSRLEKLNEIVPPATTLLVAEMVSLIVAPGWLGEGGLEKLGRLAQRTKSLLVTDFKDLPSLDGFEDSGWSDVLAGLKGEEGDAAKLWRRHVSLIGNHLEDLRANPGTYLSPAMIYAGLVHGNDENPQSSMATSVAGRALLGGLEFKPRWSLTDQKIDQLLHQAVIPVTIKNTGKGRQQVFWGASTLSDHPTLRQVTTLRVREFLSRCIMATLVDRTFMSNTDDNIQTLTRSLERFLIKNMGESETDLIKSGTVRRADLSQGGTQIDFDLAIHFKGLIEDFTLKLTAIQDEENQSWKQQVES